MSQQVIQSASHRADLVTRGRRLEYLTIGWNSLEGIIAIVAGLFAGSIALVGFGLDSLIELLSGAALLWRLHLDAPERRERAEVMALKIVYACRRTTDRHLRLSVGHTSRRSCF